MQTTSNIVFPFKYLDHVGLWQELEEAQGEVEEKMTRKLQMPPVMEERDAASKVTKANMPWKTVFDI